MSDEAVVDEVESGVDDAAQVPEDEDPVLASIKEHFEAGIELTDDELDKIADIAISYLRDILHLFGEEHPTIDEYDGDDGELILDISGGDLAILIGRHGRTLDALQMLTSSYLSNVLKFHYPLVVDIEGYKSRRKEKLQSQARSAAARAKRQQGRVALPPMNAYERRLVHMALVDDPEVTTHSEGEDPDRRVVVTYVKE